MKKISLFLLLFITACSIMSPSVSILDNAKCELPCWNGITPGETSQPEAVQIIGGLDGVDAQKTLIVNQPWKIFSQQIWFYLYTDPSLAKVQTDGVVYFIGDKVSALLLQRNIGRTFADMVELVGEPEAIIVMPFPDSPVVIAIVPSRGVMYEFYAKSDDLKPETQIDNVMFFDRSQYDALMDAGMFTLGEWNSAKTKEIMHPWKGYGNIKELYPIK